MVIHLRHSKRFFTDIMSRENTFRLKCILHHLENQAYYQTSASLSWKPSAPFPIVQRWREIMGSGDETGKNFVFLAHPFLLCFVWILSWPLFRWFRASDVFLTATITAQIKQRSTSDHGDLWCFQQFSSLSNSLGDVTEMYTGLFYKLQSFFGGSKSVANEILRPSR